MPTVRLAFTPAPVHVRTARLVGVAVARRAGVSDAVLDEVRLAIGEACSRAVALHRRHHLPDLVEVEFVVEDKFSVRVTDRAPVEVPSPATVPADESLDRTDPFGLLLDASTGQGQVPKFVDDPTVEIVSDEVVVEVSLTLLIGLVEELAVVPPPSGPGTQVQMTWPTGSAR
jgi:hypothetical protein